MCGKSISSICLCTDDRQVTAFFLWRSVFCSLTVLWPPPMSYCILPVKNLFLQFECALSTANLLLQSFCEESFSSVCVTLPLIGRFDQRLHHMGPFEKYISICILGHIGHLNTRRLHLWQVEDDGPNLPCDTCDSKGWLLCDFCQGQKVNVQVRANKFYRRCPSCRAVSS